MEYEINKQLEYIKSKWFIISDEGKVRWYLEKVWLHRLSRYYNIVEEYEWIDFQKIIDAYVFDKSFRHINVSLLESIEKSFKCQIVLNFNTLFDEELYLGEYKDSRLSFLYLKLSILKKKDNEVKKVFKNTWNIPIGLFIDKLQFWEVYKIFLDFKKVNQYKVVDYYGIDYKLFVNWIQCISYLRNLCSHWENIFNRKFTFSIKANELFEEFGIKNNNVYISYLYILTIFNYKLSPTYNWEEKIFNKLKYYNLTLSDFWAKKETFHSQLDSEAWKVLVDKLYTKYVKRQK